MVRIKLSSQNHALRYFAHGMSRLDGRVFYLLFNLLFSAKLSYLDDSCSLFRKAIVKAHCHRLKRLRMLLISRQRRLPSVLASLDYNSAAAKRAKRQSVRHIFPCFMRVEKPDWTNKLLQNTIPAYLVSMVLTCART